jgi:hypothetical protein
MKFIRLHPHHCQVDKWKPWRWLTCPRRKLASYLAWPPRWPLRSFFFEDIPVSCSENEDWEGVIQEPVVFPDARFNASFQSTRMDQANRAVRK